MVAIKKRLRISKKLRSQAVNIDHTSTISVAKLQVVPPDKCEYYYISVAEPQVVPPDKTNFTTHMLGNQVPVLKIVCRRSRDETLNFQHTSTMNVSKHRESNL